MIRTTALLAIAFAMSMAPAIAAPYQPNSSKTKAVVNQPTNALSQLQTKGRLNTNCPRGWYFDLAQMRCDHLR